RPSRHSGKPVRSATSVTGMPSPSMSVADPPVETIATPASCSPRTRSSRPVLTKTEMSARRTGRRSWVGPGLLTETAMVMAPIAAGVVLVAGCTQAGDAVPCDSPVVVHLRQSSPPMLPAGQRAPVPPQPADEVDEQLALLHLDPLVQRLLGVAVEDLDRALGEDRAGVDSCVDEVRRRPGDLHPMG